jgi:hypothetical protein
MPSDRFYRSIGKAAAVMILVQLGYFVGYILGIARMAGRCP